MEVPWTDTPLTRIRGVCKQGQTSFDPGRHLVSYRFRINLVKQARLSLCLHVCILFYFLSLRNVDNFVSGSSGNFSSYAFFNFNFSLPRAIALRSVSLILNFLSDINFKKVRDWRKLISCFVISSLDSL